MERKTSINIWYGIIAIFAVLWLQDLFTSDEVTATIPYSEFEKHLKEGEIANVVVSDQYIYGTLRNPQPNGTTGVVATRVEPDLADRLSEYGVTYTRAVENTYWQTILSWLVPMLVFFALWMFFIRRFAEKQGMGGFSQPR